MSISGPEYCGKGDTAGAYLLRALPEDEAYAFELHLASCAQCQRDVHQLQAAADALGTAVPTVSPPPELGQRIRGIVRAEAELLRAAGPEADRPARKARARWWRGQRRLQPRIAVAATLAVGVLCGVVVGSTLLGGSTPGTRTINARVLEPTVARYARATLAVTGQHGTLNVTHFPRPPAGRVYEVWELGSGRAPRPTDALFSVNSRGSGTVAVPGPLHGVREILVTAEPLGGSQVPTRSPIIEASTAT
ncbi:MAG TPA: anti-sigma factor [Solirubrobacteraceae bacterium]|jgi:anti-sigma-K factor RskA|nr:anti-sigma factor [Solirubrobacteraceae bacterium]